MVAVGLPARLFDLLPGGIRLAVGHILGNGTPEQPGVLKHHAEIPAHLVPGKRPDILPVQQNFAAVHVIKPHQQVDNGGFSRAGGADDGHTLAGMDTEVQILDQRLALAVGKCGVVENDLTLTGLWKHALRLLLFLHIQQPEHPLGAGLDVAQVGKSHGDLLQR